MWDFMNDQPLKLKAPLHSNEILLSSSRILRRADCNFPFAWCKATGPHIYLRRLYLSVSVANHLEARRLDKTENLNHVV